MNGIETKQAIVAALRAFQTESVGDAGVGLLHVLGYSSQKRIPFAPNTPAHFVETFAHERAFNQQQAMLSDWRSVELLFQLTDDEVRAAATKQQLLAFESHGQWDGKIMQSYLFGAITLDRDRYSRTELAGMTRAVNRLFSMPVLLLFRYGDSLSLAIIERRLSKRDQAKDVLEKVTLIKDITVADPLRAHIEILHDLSLAALHEEFYFHNFVGLHQAWQKRLSSYALNQRFYREVADWYFWALGAKGVTLPRSIEGIRDREEREKQRAIFLIRLLTRLIFCWFLQEKRLIPRDLFRARVAKELLADSSPKAGTYYRAFLQNLFFATLNQEQDSRGWRKKYKRPRARDGNRGVTNLWRYQDLLTDPQRLESLLRDQIPFINGGLFDCLDDVRDDKEQPNVRLDDFSEEQTNTLCLPNELFFGEEREIDLSEVYDDKRRKHERVRGIIEILSRYKFTVEENTPLEEEVALDPELLGKVFENLLASYNEDTRTTARKALGAFYTPREIVDYMVDESLRSYLSSTVPSVSAKALSDLFVTHVAHYPAGKRLSSEQTSALVAAIGQVKILDPACGSGAFPMGSLRRLVDLLQKLDPNNQSWKRDRLAAAERYLDVLRLSDAAQEEIAECEAHLDDIRHSFDTRFHALDFARKLYLIENCVYGVDIQPIACQIAKLRFFIALIVDQHVDPCAPNLGVRPLPNLETKIVAADSLVPIKKPQQQLDLLHTQAKPLRRQLEQVRHEHFSARTLQRKANCRERDAALRAQIAKLLEDSGFPAASAHALAAWDPYDQNHAAQFFDTEWMFGLTVGKVVRQGKGAAPLRGNFAFVNELAGQKEFADVVQEDSGFDIVIGNPPYVRQEQIKAVKPQLRDVYECFTGTADIYVYFYEAALRLLRPNGVLAFISSNKWFRAAYGTKLRSWITRNAQVLRLIDFGDAPVFTAIAYPCVMIARRIGRVGVPTDTLRVLTWQPTLPIGKFAQTFAEQSFEFTQDDLQSPGWKFERPGMNVMRKRLESCGTPLGTLAQERIFNGIKSGHKRAFTLTREQRDELIAEEPSSRAVIKPLLEGRDIKRWRVDRVSSWLLYIPWHFPLQERLGVDPSGDVAERAFKKRYPKTFAHLVQFREELEKRDQSEIGIRYEWFCVSRPRPEAAEHFDVPKIVFPDIAPAPSFAWDEEGHAIENTAYLIPGFKWLLAVLNSPPAFWFCCQVSNTIRGGFVRFIRQYVEQIPIPSITASQEAQVVRLVDYLLWLNRHFQEAAESKTDRGTLMLGYFEHVLNGLVYELYFPDELHEHGLRLFDLVDEAGLPELNAIPGPERMTRLREVFETIYDLKHPLRGALHALGSLDTVRIIEGKS